MATVAGSQQPRKVLTGDKKNVRHLSPEDYDYEPMTSVFQELARRGQVTTGSVLSEPQTTAWSSEVASRPRGAL